MPEPSADVFGDKGFGVPTSGDEDGLLGKGGPKMNGAGDIVLSNGVDEHGPEDSSICCRCSCCSLLIFCLCLLSFFLGTQWEAVKQNVKLNEKLDQLQESYWAAKTKTFRATEPKAAKGETKTVGARSTTSTTTARSGTPQVQPQSFSSLDSIEKALACMRLTTPKLEAKYPSDADEHFEELHANVSKIVTLDFPPHVWAGYRGPWIENHWMRNFTKRWFNRSKGTKLKDIFGPFIPIFVPWVDLAVRNKNYPPPLIKLLMTEMRKDVLYITVSQHDLGIFNGAKNSRIPRAAFANLLVLSAGGYGHVPVPLLKQPEQPLKPYPMSKRKYLVSFVGSATNRGRLTIKTKVEEWSNRTHKETLVSLKHLRNWKDILLNSSVTLVPRGFGRSSFRCGEMLQMGRVPLYIWDDLPWIFYRELWEKEQIGFSYRINQVAEALDHIAQLDLKQLEKMENRILHMRDTHFTYEGIMDQISKFMTGRAGGSDLRCQKFPEKRRRLRLGWLEWLQSWAQNSLMRLRRYR